MLAALRDDKLGLIDNWLRHVQDVRRKHAGQLDALATEGERHDRLCELNVIEQVVNVSQTTVVRDAWARGQALAVHGWIYDLTDGLLRDLGLCVTCPDDVPRRKVLLGNRGKASSSGRRDCTAGIKGA